jgi:hypothetical protein
MARHTVESRYDCGSQGRVTEWCNAPTDVPDVNAIVVYLSDVRNLTTTDGMDVMGSRLTDLHE